ncbi:MAG: polyphosphate kinase 1, partial [Bacteroidota bacterium]
MPPTRRYLNRDLSWLKFNKRVLDQAARPEKTLRERLRFLTISASNLDEFLMIRIGALYNYLHYDQKKSEQADLKHLLRLHELLEEAQTVFQKQHHCLLHTLLPQAHAQHHTLVQDLQTLSPSAQKQLKHHFRTAIFPMLTPMVFDSQRPFPILLNQVLILGVVTCDPKAPNKKISFIQLPKNLPRFYRLQQQRTTIFVPIEALIRAHLDILFKNVSIHTTTTFRIIRNGDLSLEDMDDMDANFLEVFKRKLKTRDQGQVVCLEIEAQPDPWFLEVLQQQLSLDQHNVWTVPAQSFADLTSLQSLGQSLEFPSNLSTYNTPVSPLFHDTARTKNIFERLRQQDILLHHPYNSFQLIIQLLESAAEDSQVLAIKMTIYRLAPKSAITAALLQAIRNGKHVSVLFEVKARFDEAQNMAEARKLEKAGCFVIYGIGTIKTHAKMMMIVRQEADSVVRYVHLSSGNYNEETALGYTDIALVTADESYANDVAEFFNVITGHSMPQRYENLLTTPLNLREALVNLIRQEAHNAQQGLPAGIVLKVNALEDKATIEALYQASQANVPIHLIVRGICCLIPGQPGLSKNITVRSIVGDFLEHARVFYFHQQGNPKVYAGSSDIMARNFDRRIEALFAIRNPALKQQVIHLLTYNLLDNVNAYLMQPDGT